MSFDPRKTRKHVADLDRRNEALKLWYGGMTYEAIAEELGYSDRSSAWNAVQTAKKHLPDEAAEARSQAFNRIIGPLLKMRDAALEGDPQAAAQHRGYEERVAKMFGIDAVVKTEVDVQGAGLTIMVNPDRLPPQATEEIEGK